jgi:hypothetical protein
MTAKEIIEALMARSNDFIWASELDFFGGLRRIDFWTLEPIKSKGFRATSYEIKISRADFRRDSEDKQSGALKFCDRFYYVTPPALISKSEIPEWAGLQEWDGVRFNQIKRAPAREKAEPTWEFIVSIMRNCGESRRDVGLFKQIISHYEFREAQAKRMQHMSQRFRIQEWQEAQAAPVPGMVGSAPVENPCGNRGDND